MVSESRLFDTIKSKSTIVWFAKVYLHFSIIFFTFSYFFQKVYFLLVFQFFSGEASSVQPLKVGTDSMPGV